MKHVIFAPFKETTEEMLVAAISAEKNNEESPYFDPRQMANYEVLFTGSLFVKKLPKWTEPPNPLPFKGYKHPISYVDVMSRDQVEAAIAAANDDLINYEEFILEFPAFQENIPGMVKIQRSFYRQGYVAHDRHGKPVVVKRHFFGFKRDEMNGKTCVGERGVVSVQIQRCTHPAFGQSLIVNYWPNGRRTAGRSIRMGDMSKYDGKVIESFEIPGTNEHVYIVPHKMFVPKVVKQSA
ncbi:MAG: hypothetical protein ACPGO5_01675 [Patescibacteria group bacterium]